MLTAIGAIAAPCLRRQGGQLAPLALIFLEAKQKFACKLPTRSGLSLVVHVTGLGFVGSLLRQTPKAAHREDFLIKRCFADSFSRQIYEMRIPQI